MAAMVGVRGDRREGEREGGRGREGEREGGRGEGGRGAQRADGDLRKSCYGMLLFCCRQTFWQQNLVCNPLPSVSPPIPPPPSPLPPSPLPPLPSSLHFLPPFVPLSLSFPFHFLFVTLSLCLCSPPSSSISDPFSSSTRTAADHRGVSAEVWQSDGSDDKGAIHLTPHTARLPSREVPSVLQVPPPPPSHVVPPLFCVLCKIDKINIELSVCLSVCLSTVCLSVCLSICLSVCPSVCPSVCLSV